MESRFTTTLVKGLTGGVLMLVAFVVLAVSLVLFAGDGASVRMWLNSPISELKVGELLFILFVTALLAKD